MKRFFTLPSTVIIGMLIYIILGASYFSKTIISVDGFLFGRPFITTVDDSLAKLMVENPTDPQVLQLFGKYDKTHLNTKTLAEIAENYSMDVATFYFVQKSYQDIENKQAQDLYLSYLDKLSGNIKKELEPLQEYYVVFVPGMNYKDTTNGGDFARQRKLLTAAGVANEMIVTENWGLTEVNAHIVALRLKHLSKLYGKIIIVSASKGGLETAVALGKILKPEETSSIKSWISVGGVLRGSPVADTYLHWPKCWIAEIALMTKGKKINLVQDVAYKKREVEFEQFNFPENIKIVHFVGAPLATQINKRIKGLHSSIKKFGPNDGLTPLADEVTENGIVVTELGLDHHYKHPDIDKKTIALALVVTKIQN